jgi:hypothetical protein
MYRLLNYYKNLIIRNNAHLNATNGKNWTPLNDEFCINKSRENQLTP